jgi:ubiquinone/menaquinone biosynthesis C-methylase UbiE
MAEKEPDLHFKLMALSFRIRDFFLPRGNVLKEVGISQGSQILDYGCGPGSYTTAVAEMVGESGMVYALDMNPLAVKSVRDIASKRRLENVKTILSDCKTGLPQNSLDTVLLYDTFHELDDPDNVLEELYRVLKPGAVLSLSDHHMKEDEIVSGVTNLGLFKLDKKNRRTYSFLKVL